MKSPVSRIVPKNVTRASLGFLNIHSVAKFQKIDGGTIKKTSGKNEKFEQSHSAEKKGKCHSVEKSGKGDPSVLKWLFISC